MYMFFVSRHLSACSVLVAVVASAAKAFGTCLLTPCHELVICSSGLKKDGCSPHPSVLGPAWPAGSREDVIPHASSPALLWLSERAATARLGGRVVLEVPTGI